MQATSSLDGSKQTFSWNLTIFHHPRVLGYFCQENWTLKPFFIISFQIIINTDNFALVTKEFSF